MIELTLGHGPQGRFDADHLRAIHHHLFQDVYEWAGQTRDERVELSDGTIATEPVMHKPGGADFLIGRFIPDALDDLAKRLRDADHLRGLSREEFAARAADLLAEMNAIHPFREGNGRTQRTFVRELAKEAGHSLDFAVVSKERMIRASIAANEDGDPTMMHRLFNEISDPSRVAALRQAIEFFEKQRFPWNDRYLATTEPGHPLELTMVGTAGRSFHGPHPLANPHRQQVGSSRPPPPEPSDVYDRPERGGRESHQAAWAARSQPIRSGPPPDRSRGSCRPGAKHGLNGCERSDEPIGKVFGRIPRPGHPARIVIDALNEFGIIQTQQNGVKPIDDLLHERAHFVVADA